MRAIVNLNSLFEPNREYLLIAQVLIASLRFANIILDALALRNI